MSNRRRKVKKKEPETLDKYLIAALAYIVAWSVAFFLAWLVKGTEPSTLEASILAPGLVEMICTACLKNSKNKYKSDSQPVDGAEESYYFDEGGQS